MGYFAWGYLTSNGTLKFAKLEVLIKFLEKCDQMIDFLCATFYIKGVCNVKLESDAVELANMVDLQTTADYLVSTKASKGRWRTSVVVGVFGIVSGFFYTLLFSSINIILILMGVLLVAAGINARIVSNPKNMILTAVALLSMGGWNLIVVASNLYVFFAYYSGYTAPLTLTWGIMLGLYCLLWGGSLLMSYRSRFSLVPNRPSDQSLRQVQDLVDPILHAKVKDEQDVIEFLVYSGAGMPKGYFRARLNKNLAIVADKNQSAIFFVRPDEFEMIETDKRVGLTSHHYFDGRIKDFKFRISIIKPLSFTRYQNWKKSVTA
jgi:hypothetical protein